MTVSVVTGKPGHGKTLYAVSKLSEKAKTENRQVYYHGIPDLKLDWIEFDNPHDWIDPDVIPDGAIVIIDEAQRHFPPRATGSKVPPHVQLFDTHRHRGLDIYLITQDPMLIDSFARNLAGEHIHVLRPFGTQQAKIYRWEHVVDPDSRSERNLAVDTGHFRYDKKVFDLYKSATVHTVKRKIPWKLAFGVPALIVGLIVSVMVAMSILGNKATSSNTVKDLSKPTATGVDPEQKKVVDLGDPKNYKAAIAGRPETAPIYSEVAKISVIPVMSACVEMAGTCKCYTQQGTLIKDAHYLICAEFVDNGRFNPYDPKILHADARGNQGNGSQDSEPVIARPKSIIDKKSTTEIDRNESVTVIETVTG